MGVAVLAFGAALLLFALATSPDEPTPIVFHDLSTATAGSWQQQGDRI